jgi:selenocysteine lyase/cysteine desulfurase
MRAVRLPPVPEIVDPPPLDRASLDALLPGSRYFNVAGCGPTMPVVRAAIERHARWLDAVAMFSHAGYAEYDAELARTRDDLAAFIGDPGGGARFTLLQSATAALNVVLAALRFARPARIVTTDQEHASALLPAFARRERGDEVLVVPYTGDHAAFLERLDRELAGGGALLLSHVSHKSGAVLPVREASALARRRGAFSIVDGAQAVGQIPVDVRDIGCDAYCLLGHKWLHGPLGTGALWLRDPLDARLVPPVLGWRSRESSDIAGNVTLKPSGERFESGTVDVSAFFGVRQALAVHRALGPRVCQRLEALRATLLGALEILPLQLESRPHDPTGIVRVRPRSADVQAAVDQAWDEFGVVIKASVGSDEPDAIRISFWYLHDDAAVDDLARCLHTLLPAD